MIRSLRNPTDSSTQTAWGLVLVLAAAGCSGSAPAAKKAAKAEGEKGEKGEKVSDNARPLDLPFATAAKIETTTEDFTEGGKRAEWQYRRDAEGNQVKHGKYMEFYRNTRRLPEPPKSVEGEYVNGQKNGRWMEWDEQGQATSETYYRDGKQDGRWTKWNRAEGTQTDEEYRLGELRSVKIHTQDQAGAFNVRTGEWVDYFPGGKKKSVERYIENLEDGEWLNWHAPDPKNPNAQPVKAEERRYKRGKPDGTWRTFYASGIRKSVREFQDGKPQGKLESWYEDARKEEEGAFEDGQKSGMWTAWLPNGQKTKQIEYVAGKPEGLATEWYMGEQIWLTGRYKDGQKDGEWVEYYKAASKDDIPQKRALENYKQGKRDGKCDYWYKNGKLERHEEYVDGRPAGTWTAWYDNGQQMTETRWEGGLPDGTHKRWNQEGRFLAEQLYEKGVLVKIVHSEPLKLDPKQPGKLAPAASLPEGLEPAIPEKKDAPKKGDEKADPVKKVG